MPNKTANTISGTDDKTIPLNKNITLGVTDSQSIKILRLFFFKIHPRQYIASSILFTTK